MLAPRAFEFVCFLTTAVYASCALGFLLSSSYSTGVAWLCTFSVTLAFSLAVRSERLEQRVSALHDPRSIRLANALVLFFVTWSCVEFVLAMNREDGWFQSHSKWNTVLGALLGAVSSYFLARIMQRLVDTEERQERSLLNPIGEIA
ncbi:hypothetical protein BASA81_010061 [Batrachochytrium salamandrivorans]|nr:hypothetical protein BASA81_010061 [Batrachochytrium salamandrivorans]